MNKKIKNATAITVDGITFKSKSEAKVYTKLKSEGLNPQYENMKLVLWHALFKPIKWWLRGKEVQSKIYLKDITYTPDFELDYNNRKIVIEVKGMPNDVYPYKRKLFLDYACANNIMFYEVNGSSNKEIDEMIKHIKNLK